MSSRSGDGSTTASSATSAIDDALHRRLLVLTETLAFLPLDDLSRLSRASRTLSAIARADVFKFVVPRTLDAANAFCSAIHGNAALGGHVRALELKFWAQCIAAQTDFEHSLLQTLPSLTRLVSFRWLLECKPFVDDIWHGLKTHCPLLCAVDINCANGIKPQSALFQLGNLTEFRIRSWTSGLEPTAHVVLCTLPLLEDQFRPFNHPLTSMLTQSPRLTVLELNIHPSFRPALSALLSSRWPRLQELVLAPVTVDTPPPPAPTTHEGDAPHEPPLSTSALLVAFLVAHPSLKTLRLGAGTRGTAPAPAAYGNPPPLLTDPRLPDTALPHLRTFEGVSVEDAIVICAPAAGRRVAKLPRVEGRLRGAACIPRAMGSGTVARAGAGENANEGSSSAGPSSAVSAESPGSPLSDNSPDPNTAVAGGDAGASPEPELVAVETLARALAAMPTVTVIALHLRGTLLGRRELRAIVAGLPNVRHLILEGTSACRSSTEVLRALAPLGHLRSLEIDGSFVHDKTARQFTNGVSRACARVQRVTVRRELGAPESYEIRYARQRGRRERSSASS